MRPNRQKWMAETVRNDEPKIAIHELVHAVVWSHVCRFIQIALKSRVGAGADGLLPGHDAPSEGTSFDGLWKISEFLLGVTRFIVEISKNNFDRSTVIAAAGRDGARQ